MVSPTQPAFIEDCLRANHLHRHKFSSFFFLCFLAPSLGCNPGSYPSPYLQADLNGHRGGVQVLDLHRKSTCFVYRDYGGSSPPTRNTHYGAMCFA